MVEADGGATHEADQLHRALEDLVRVRARARIRVRVGVRVKVRVRVRVRIRVRVRARVRSSAHVSKRHVRQVHVALVRDLGHAHAQPAERGDEACLEG